MNDLSRRDFLHSAAAIAALGATASGQMEGSGAKQKAAAAPATPSGVRTAPVVIASANGLRAVERATTLIFAGADTLDAVIAGVNIVEGDPNDHSVGLGGIPNEDGVVELDASVMHGPSCRCGAVGALQRIKNASSVAKAVMERTDHIFLAGDGALRFAKAHGFKECDLLTEDARRIWLKWKESHSAKDNWIPPPEASDEGKRSDARLAFPYTYGTINCLALNPAGDLSGSTTTSGLSFKLPGRVGDSPIIGAGLYVDNAVGAAGSTGRGEANIKICGAHTIVEAMRHGMAPLDACLLALRRVVDTTTEARLKHPDGRPNFDIKFYALAKDGRFGAASLWSGAKFAVSADGRSRLEECAYFFERPTPP